MNEHNVAVRRVGAGTVQSNVGFSHELVCKCGWKRYADSRSEGETEARRHVRRMTAERRKPPVKAEQDSPCPSS